MPGDYRRELLKAKIQPGCIIHIPCDFIVNPHSKFILICHIDNSNGDVLLFLINSNIHILLANDPRFAKCQVELKNDPPYDFLDHTSYIDCTEVFYDFNIDDIVEHLLVHTEDYKIKISDGILERVIEAVHFAPSVTQIDKDLIIASLDQ